MLEANSTWTKSHRHATCSQCGEDCFPDLMVGESRRWDCQRCDHAFMVKLVEPDVYATADFEEL